MTTMRQAAAARTRAALIDAGFRLAERTGLAGLSVNLVVEDAQVAKGTFFHHFGDRAGYLVALHRDFHDRIAADILRSTGGLPPGAQRLIVGANTYLDACLRERGVRALLLEARAERAILDEVSTRNAAVAALIKPDFQAMDWPHPLPSARLWIGLTVEAALLELERSRRQPTVRAALARFLQPL